MQKIIISLIISLVLLPAIANDDVYADFIHQMASQHGFKPSTIKALLDQAKISQTILKAISKPAEKKAWYQYRKIFIQKKRIVQGLKFWQNNHATLARVEKEYGIPPEIIVSIIGVETFYGKHSGKYRVIDALTTLGFFYPPRAKFFRSELEQFLLLVRDGNHDPLSLKGSYAGAMGIPQFISSSYRNYAIDYDGDNKIDIWNNASDAIGSVANYFKQHGWHTGQMIATQVHTKSNKHLALIDNKLEPPNLNTNHLIHYDIIAKDISHNTQAKLYEYELKSGKEYWLTYHNFYVITRYNHSILYAMAVYQLSHQIKQAMNKTP